MLVAERVACLFWMALSLLVGMGSYRLGLGTPQEPESGFLPFWTAVLLCLLAIVHFIRLAFSASKGIYSGAMTWGEHCKRVVILILTLSAYAISLPSLGYLIATFVLMIVLFSLYERRKWWIVFGSSLLVVGITHLVFHSWLKIQFPKGIMGIG